MVLELRLCLRVSQASATGEHRGREFLSKWGGPGMLAHTLYEIGCKKDCVSLYFVK